MIQSVDRALRIVELFVANETMSLTEISQEMMLPKSTVFGLLETLQAHGYLRRDTDTARYSLGLSVLKLGGLFSARLNIRDVAYPAMQELSVLTNQTVPLSILSGFNIVYVERVAPDGQLYQFATRVGNTYPAHCTATGKMLLALLPEEELDTLLRGRELQQVTANTITDQKILRKELALIRKRGYSIDDRESHDQIYGVATPIYDQQGKAVAALSCGGFIGGFVGLVDTILEHLQAATDKISRDLGYQGAKNEK